MSLFQRGREFVEQQHDVNSKDDGSQDPLVVSEPGEDHEDEAEAGHEDEGLKNKVEEEEADEDEAGEASQDHQFCGRLHCRICQFFLICVCCFCISYFCQRNFLLDRIGFVNQIRILKSYIKIISLLIGSLPTNNTVYISRDI